MVSLDWSLFEKWPCSSLSSFPCCSSFTVLCFLHIIQSCKSNMAVYFLLVTLCVCVCVCFFIFYIPTTVPPPLLPPVPHPTPSPSTPPCFFRKGQVSRGYQPAMAYEVAVRLGTSPDKTGIGNLVVSEADN